MKSQLKIISFEEIYAKTFYQLNIEWLEAFFFVEDFDREVLSNPKKYIIEKGGYIFFLLENTEIIGTIALMKKKEMIYELTKMAIVPEKRGKKMGQYLMDYCIEFAKNKNLIKLVLYSNTLLENAIHIYLKKGFKKIPVEKNCPYKRSNIKMELLLVDKN
ncbi:MAG: GNAT family N-acetyltransferase [Flavobacteriaceae bacterium]|jgi:N-acetylglutamate synthase-like GNAT family acetyltransferase|nr:GNAT family N-acetyltransferase [Flavobacteriaceae bacterium]MDG1160967.1 GNAT family N-acetyltransferase [Flavobacteriaceae bacterium]MDG2444635.1 GNAT family N-acetyltransferase [Flavobacteriaceae bacterium]|tara:strand:- start:1344 stop:1823 length:480 start_codon:yes stop_codon:yes gene_type:complete